MRVESGDIRYPHFSGDNQAVFPPPQKRPGPRLLLGVRRIRLLQETAVRAFVMGSDVFLSIPTVVASRCAMQCFLMCSTCFGATTHHSLW